MLIKHLYCMNYLTLCQRYLTSRNGQSGFVKPVHRIQGEYNAFGFLKQTIIRNTHAVKAWVNRSY